MSLRIDGFSTPEPGSIHARGDVLVVTLSCDHPNCQEDDQIVTDEYTAARREFKKRGWVERINGDFICPQHAGAATDPRQVDLFT